MFALLLIQHVSFLFFGSSARTRGHNCGGSRGASGEVLVCGCAGATSDERDSVVAELQSHLSAARARLIEQDRELSRARRAAMATESMSRQIHTAAEQTEMAARRGMTSVEEAADLQTARLRLDLASSEAQRSMLERHLAAAREELDSKQSLAGKCIYLSVSFTFEVQVSSRIVARVYVFKCTELEPNGRLLHCVTACQFIC